MVQKITILDGDMGQADYLRSGKAASPLWFAQVMLGSPKLFVALYCDYIEAGADLLAD